MKHDVVVVGAGLSGLIAGLELQRAGRRVLILERRAVAGGLCGSHLVDGFEFGTACADFGAGFLTILRELGVEQRFTPARVRVVRAHESFDLPPSWRDGLTWLQILPDALRVGRALRGRNSGYLAPLVKDRVRNPRFAALLDTLAHALAIAPEQVRIESLRQELNGPWRYGYQKPIAPIGGPAALVSALVGEFRNRGGTLRLETPCRAIRDEGAEKVVICDETTFAARAVLTSEGRWEEYPAQLKPGLAAGFLHLAVERALAFPGGIHTLLDFPSGSGEALARLDAGEPALERAPLLVSHRGIPGGPDSYTLTATMLMPRGREAPSDEEIDRLERGALDRLERLLPGLRPRLLHHRFLCPKAFEELHGLSSRPTPYVRTPALAKPDVYDAERNLYFLGNSVGPPGDHAVAAALSGRWAARRADAAL